MFNKKGICREWFLSYILILSVPLIAILISYYYNVNIIKKETLKANELVADNLSINVDNYIEAQRNMYFYFYDSEDLSNLMYAQDMDAEFYDEVRNFCGKLEEYTLGASGLTYWLYLENKDYILSNVTTGKSTVIYNRQTMLSKYLLEYEDWISFLQGEYNNEYLINDAILTKDSESALSFANSYKDIHGNRCNMFVSIPIKNIKKLTSNLMDDTIFAISFENRESNNGAQLLALNADGRTTLPKALDLAGKIKSSEIMESDDYVILSQKSQIRGVNYFLLVPKESFWKAASSIRNVHFISLIMAFIIGMLVISKLLKRNFQPISNIIQLIGKESAAENEFEMIKEAYGFLQNENKDMKKVLLNNRRNMRSSYLLKILKGRVQSDNERKQEAEWVIDKQFYILVGIYVPFEGRAKDDELMFFSIDNVMNELLENISFCSAEDGRILFYLCMFDEYELVEQIHDKVNYLCELMGELMNIDLSIVISNAETNIERVQYLYQSVMETLEYKKIIGGNGIITTEEWFETEEESQVRVNQKILIRALENGNPVEVYRAGESLFVASKVVPFGILRIQILDSFQRIRKSYDDIVKDPIKRIQIMEWLDLLLKAEDIDSLKENYFKMLDWVLEKNAGQWKIENGGVVESIKRTIEKCYMETELNIGFVARQIEKNPKYISKVFKEETGEGILDYINTLRIRKAQELLLTTEATVEKVSEMVGYSSVKTFRRCFVKVVGMNPSSYIEKNK